MPKSTGVCFKHISYKMNTNRDASQRLNFEFSKVSLKDYSKLTKIIINKFNLKPDGELVHGLDETFQDYKLGSFLIALTLAIIKSALFQVSLEKIKELYI